MSKTGRQYEFELVPTKTQSGNTGSSSESSEDDFFVSRKLKSPRRKAERIAAYEEDKKAKRVVLLGLLLIFFIIFVASIAVTYFSYYLVKGTGQEYDPAAGRLWRVEIDRTATEMSILVHDVNRDGVPDLVTDAPSDKVVHPEYLVCPGKENLCMKKFSLRNCRSRVVAYDGQTGRLIWQKFIEFSPFATNCKHDLDGDGIPDCVFAGRQGSLAAIETVYGSYIWFVDPAVTFLPYNYYYPLFIRDFDKDGVMDIVTTHGGDVKYQDYVMERSPGFIFVISGSTGQQISARIPMPDGHETYSNPIAYNISGDIELVLFGSGGETVPGSLWAITVQSLQEHVDTWIPNRVKDYTPALEYFDTQCLSDKEVKEMRPSFDKNSFKYDAEIKDWLADCPVWNKKVQPIWNKYEVCVYELVPAGKSGSIVPPVILDYNDDGVKDLLVPQFNDHLILLDGESGTVQWDHHTENTQSYSIPAPLNFNDDNIPDFLLRFSKGKWPNYDFSYMGIVDGSNGELLWSLNCSFGSMASAVTILNSKRGHDGMLFYANGCDIKIKNMQGNHGPNGQQDGPPEAPPNGPPGAPPNGPPGAPPNGPPGAPPNGPPGDGQHEGSAHMQTRETTSDECYTAHLGSELSQCMLSNNNRYKRYQDNNEQSANEEDEYQNITGGPPETDDYNTPEVYRPSTVNISNYNIPADIWGIRDEDDSFPDPWTDTKSFFENYCGLPSYEMFVNKVYFLTPNMIKAGKVKPIMLNKPYVYRAPVIQKRHGDDNQHDNEELAFLMEDRKAIRCAHILAPLMLISTPTIGDFNADSSLDAALSFTYGPIPGQLYSVTDLHPDKRVIDVFTIEEKFRAVFGSGIVDFNSYYPIDQQPWTAFMGSNGDCVYDP